MIKKIFVFFLFFTITGVMSSFCQEDKDYARLIKQASDNGDYEYALKLFAFALEDDYYDTESLQRIICGVYYKKGDYAQALQTAEKLYNEDENGNVTDLVYMCLLSRKTGVNDSLICEIAYNMCENPFEKNILLASDFLLPKDLDLLALAINRYIIEKEITDYDKLKHYKTLLTVVYFLNKKYTAAYNSSIDYFSYDNQAVIYYILGILRQQRGDYSSAVSMLTLAVKNGYNHYDAFLQRAVCYGHEKQYNLSNADLDTCIMIDSGYYPFYLKGVNYNHLRDYTKAMLCLDYSIYLNDTFADSYNYRGIVYSHTGRYAFAVKDFQRAAALNPKTRFVYNNLGLTLEKTGNITEAVHYYKKATKTDPDLPDAYYNLGRIYILLKDYDKALSYLKKSLARDASLPDTYYLAGISYQGKNDKVKACDMYNKALEKGHTLAQEKIDDYCNKEDTAEDKDGENLDKQEFILPEVQYED